MAKEYIEREAAIAAVDCTEVIVGDWIRNNIQKIPTADVRPVVRGRWDNASRISRKGFEWFKCSNCGMEWSNLTNFCPNCGADMREV